MTITAAQLEEALSKLNVSLAILDKNFNFVHVNRAYAAVSGEAPEFFIGKNHFNLYPHEENEALFRRVLMTGEPLTERARPFEHPDQPDRGTTYWDVSLQKVVPNGDSAEALLLTLIDVTEHVRTIQETEKNEQKLKEGEARYRLLFNGGNDVILVHGSDPKTGMPGRFIEANDLACRRLGYSREELLEMSPTDIDVPGYPRNSEKIFRGVAHAKQGLFESRHRAKDGREFPVEINVRFLELEGRGTHVVSIVRDISQRKQAEEERARSEQNLSALFNATRESAFLLDVNGTILAMNEIGAERLNIAPAAAVGRNIYDLIPPDLVVSRKMRVEETINTKHSVMFEDVRDGRRLSHSLYPVPGSDGAIRGVAVYSADITALSLLESIEDLAPAINQKTLAGEPLQEIFKFVCTRTAEIFDLALVWVGRKEKDGSVTVLTASGTAVEYTSMLAKVGVRWDDSPLGRGPTGQAVRNGVRQICDPKEARFNPWGGLVDEFGLKSVLSFPLIIRGNVYGAFTLYSGKPGAFDSPTAQKHFATLSSRLCLVLEMAMNQERIRLLSTALSSAGNAVMITDRDGHIQWVNPSFTRLSGYSETELIGQTPSILKSGKQDIAYYRELWDAILGGRIWSNETTERRKDGSIYTVQQTITPIRSDEGEISHFIAVHEDITAKLETQERIRHLAHYDALTGLPNRALFYDRMRHSLSLANRGKVGVALLFMDLDGFKKVNDSLGHQIGDLLLKAVADRLHGCIRDSDTLARLGGDEFTAILYDVAAHEGAVLVARKILQEISRPYRLMGHDVSVGISIGIAFHELNVDNEAKLIKRADAAMYEAKRRGKNTYCLSEDAESQHVE